MPHARRAVLTPFIVVAALTVPATADAAVTTGPAPIPTGTQADQRAPVLPGKPTTTRQFDHAKRVMNRVPRAMKRTPTTAPRYKKRVARALRRSYAGSHHGQQLFSWFGCSVSVAKFLLQYGFPLARVVSYLYRARAAYGSTYGILRALRDGRVFADLGDDAQDVLAALIGAGDLIDSCF